MGFCAPPRSSILFPPWIYKQKNPPPTPFFLPSDPRFGSARFGCPPVVLDRLSLVLTRDSVASSVCRHISFFRDVFPFGLVRLFSPCRQESEVVLFPRRYFVQSSVLRNTIAKILPLPQFFQSQIFICPTCFRNQKSSSCLILHL